MVWPSLLSNSRVFHFSKKKPGPDELSLHSLLPSDPGDHKSTFPLHWFAFSGHPIEIDSHTNIPDDEFLTKTNAYEKIVFVLEAGSRKASIFLRYALCLTNKECVVVTNIPFKFEGQRKRNNALETLEYLLSERANVEIIKNDAIVNKLGKGAIFAQVIEACRSEFMYIIAETTKI